NVARAAAFMLFAQVEPGHACPISMSHAAVPTLRLAPELARQWLPRLFSRNYDGGLGGGGKSSALLGMAMTEKQGGSDVRANLMQAHPVLAQRGSSASEGREYLLTGHKWFCSAPMSDAFLVLAQIQTQTQTRVRTQARAEGVEGGSGQALSCFLVPRVLPDGTRNVFRIQRLKDKLGNRSNASSEVEFDRTVGMLVGEPGRGVAAIIEMVARTRLDCVLGTAAGMRQATAEALWHVRHRRAFGSLLIDQPAMTAVVADLALESEAATATALRLARANDDDGGQEVAFRRIATAVAKYWICKRGPQHAYEALECLGGNGYTEDFPLAMRYREQPVMAVWEGSGNIIALDVLRAIARDRPSVDAFEAEVGLAAGADRAFDAHWARTRKQLDAVSRSEPAAAAAQARMLTENLALALQASLLLRHSPSPVAEAFIAARLGPERGIQYGALPAGLDFAAILERH
ncbi:MAG TPA: acyl-CoA dehydrogenase family protein, partial [Micrococcaceae bacterium]|nr:acyl-CoA dehydrogenase family protein [Micrococcaceae bacterium]